MLVLRTRAIRDGIVIVLVGLVLYVISLKYDIVDHLMRFVREHETWQLDEIIVVVVYLVLAGGLFVWRRRDELLEQVRAREEAETEKARLLPKLETALKEVNELTGLLPVCAWCKRIRDDQGYWSQVDAYLAQHTGIGITHGICPDCAKGFDSRTRKLGDNSPSQ
jgi:hypothetical protein